MKKITLLIVLTGIIAVTSYADTKKLPTNVAPFTGTETPTIKEKEIKFQDIQGIRVFTTLPATKYTVIGDTWATTPSYTENLKTVLATAQETNANAIILAGKDEVNEQTILAKRDKKSKEIRAWLIQTKIVIPPTPILEPKELKKLNSAKVTADKTDTSAVINKSDFITENTQTEPEVQNENLKNPPVNELTLKKQLRENSRKMWELEQGVVPPGYTPNSYRAFLQNQENQILAKLQNNTK
jgi:hypothetical protein